MTASSAALPRKRCLARRWASPSATGSAMSVASAATRRLSQSGNQSIGIGASIIAARHRNESHAPPPVLAYWDSFSTWLNALDEFLSTGDEPGRVLAGGRLDGRHPVFDRGEPDPARPGAGHAL